MRIQHNILAMNAYRNYNTNTSAVAKNLEKLSSGYKINRAGDDAAGLAISEKMRAQITGLNAAQKNVKDGISLVKTGEGAMQEIHDMLNRMTYLATQSANGTYDNEVDRANLQKEVDSLKSEINRIADSANFNGIKLLDGSLDSSAAAAGTSPVTGIISTDYVGANSKADAFQATYVTNRPEAATKQTCAEFVVKLDDLALSAGTGGTGTVELKVGDATIKYTTADATAQTAENIRDGLLKGGCKKTAGTEVADNATSGDTADKFTGVTNSGAASTDADQNYIKIDGNIYKMTAGTEANEIKFTQVNFMGTSGEVVNPDFKVEVSMTAATGGTATGTVNPQVQKTKNGTGVGSSHQAQVNVTIDFSKLKNGDKLTTGDMNYYFKTDKNDNTTSSGATHVIDLSSILEKESDFSDPDKLEKAMVEITKQIGTTVQDDTNSNVTANKNNTWSAGNKGVSGTVGTLTFQSLSSYVGDTSGTADANKANIGGKAGAGVCDMTTEANVMKQFYAESKEAGATTSFNLDVTKLKEGDTIEIDGVTFEFTSTAVPSKKTNVAVNLGAMGISEDAGSILASQTKDVMDALKAAVDANVLIGGGAKYTSSIDGDKLTLTSKDYVPGGTAINAINEAKTAAVVKTPGMGGSLTLQIGDTADSFNQLTVSIGDMHTKALGIDGISIANQKDAAAAIDTIKSAINYVSGVRGDLGATQNRLEHTANNLSVMAENIQDAESTIRDTDIADEMMAYTKNNILVQSAQAMLAQANQIPQGVLQLLG